MEQSTAYDHLQEYVTKRLPSLGVGVFDENSDDPDFAKDVTACGCSPGKSTIG
jgi:hypothetical protein